MNVVDTQIKGCHWSQNSEPLEKENNKLQSIKGIKRILNIIEAAHKVTGS